MESPPSIATSSFVRPEPDSPGRPGRVPRIRPGRSSFILFLLVVVTVAFVTAADDDEKKGKEEEELVYPYPVLCRMCAKDVCDPEYLLLDAPSPFDQNGRNVSELFGVKQVPVQFLQNPQGSKFQVVLFKKAGCLGVGKWFADATWFPGFSWRVCVCPKCGAHLGWMYEPDDEVDRSTERPSQLGFYGIILDNVIDEALIPTTKEDMKEFLRRLLPVRNGTSEVGKEELCKKEEEPSSPPSSSSSAANDLTEEQKKFLEDCEREFADRYTDQDKEFCQFLRVPLAPPPCIHPWNAPPPRRGGWSRERHGGGGGGQDRYGRQHRHYERGGEGEDRHHDRSRSRHEHDRDRERYHDRRDRRY